MTSIVKIEAMSGVQDDGPLCYLLQIDQTFILLDCGWNENFEMGYIDAIKRQIPRINAVLISYADIPHLGALPYLVGKCGLKCPIYATGSVFRMGRLFLQDWLMGHKNVEDFNTFEMSDIDSAFELIQHVKYGQIINLKGDNGLQIMPLQAGHLIGGAIWRITKMGEEEIVYAVDFNHRKERHLNGCTFDGVGRPQLLITDAFSALHNQQKRKTRDESLVSKLITTLREGGDIMVVVDTAGRVLELAHLLDQLWQSKESGLMHYNLVFLSNVASDVIDAAKNQIEWMSDKVLRLSEGGQSNPFQFRFLRCCHTLNELNTIRSPKVVLTSGLDMESGFSRELFLEWHADSKNVVIVTGRSNERSLGSKLIRMAEARDQKRPISNVVTLAVKRRMRLEGAELDAYRQRKAEQEEVEAKLRLETVRRNIRIEEAESSDESDDELDARPQQPINTDTVDPKPEIKYDLMARFEQAQKASFFKRSRKQFPMFPYVESKPRWDDYGQIIRPEDYTLVETLTLPQIHQNNINQRRYSVKEEDEADGEKEPEVTWEAWPTKCINYVEKIEILCKVDYIDFEGRADADSIKKIIGQIRPKQLVLVHGSAPATRALAEYCEQHKTQDKVFTPLLGETIDLTVETSIFQVTLSDPLMSSLAFQAVKDVELCWVDARLRKRKLRSVMEFSEMTNELADVEIIEDGEEAAKEDEAMDVDDGSQFTPKPIRLDTVVQGEQLCLEILPSNTVPSHEAVFVNDPKLSDLRIYLSKQGFNAEFSAGVLYVNDTLKISRNSTGQFNYEGPANEEYYKIREAVYSQFAIV